MSIKMILVYTDDSVSKSLPWKVLGTVASHLKIFSLPFSSKYLLLFFWKNHQVRSELELTSSVRSRIKGFFPTVRVLGFSEKEREGEGERSSSK